MIRMLGWLMPLGILALVVGCNGGAPAQPTAKQKEALTENPELTYVALSVPNMT